MSDACPYAGLYLTPQIAITMDDDGVLHGFVDGEPDDAVVGLFADAVGPMFDETVEAWTRTKPGEQSLDGLAALVQESRTG